VVADEPAILDRHVKHAEDAARVRVGSVAYNHIARQITKERVEQERTAVFGAVGAEY